jgi:hypothetical protein
MSSSHPFMVTLTVIGTITCVISMFLTASIAFKFNDRLTRKLEDTFKIKIADKPPEAFY